MDKDKVNTLIEHAQQARAFSQAKYSNFEVGAAILADNGKIYTGCNIESTSYGLTICAERVALTKALSEGVTKFKAIAVSGPGEDYCPPCGACRQLLFDYAPDIIVILPGANKEKTINLRDLLPMAFEEKRLKNIR